MMSGIQKGLKINSCILIKPPGWNPENADRTGSGCRGDFLKQTRGLV